MNKTQIKNTMNDVSKYYDGELNTEKSSVLKKSVHRHSPVGNHAAIRPVFESLRWTTANEQT